MCLLRLRLVARIKASAGVTRDPIQHPAVLLYNANVLPIDGPGATWILLDGERVTALGTGDPPESPERVDMGGRTVLPGFIDSHVHLLFTGVGMKAAQLQGCRSAEEVAERMRSAPAGPWAHGFGFDDADFPEPLTWDHLPQDRPCIVERIDHHSAVINRKAARRYGLWSDGTGRVKGKAYLEALVRLYRTLPDKRDALRTAAQAALRRGVTTIHALEGGLGFSHADLEMVVEHADQVGPRLIVYPQVGDVDYVRSLGLTRLGGCLLLDGSLGSRTARLLEPYADDPSATGLLYFEDDKLAGLMRKAERAGLQLAFHAIGDGAVAQAVRCYRTLESPRGHRIEHCELATPQDLDAIARLGLQLGVQPQFEAEWGGPGRMYEQRLGASRMVRTNPLRWYRQHGVVCGGGSDSDVTPLDPLLGIQAAVLHPHPDQRLSVDEALELFTLGSARIGLDDARVGSLKAGKQADLVVLQQDPRTVPPDQIHRIAIEQVWLQGRIVIQEQFDTFLQT